MELTLQFGRADGGHRFVNRMVAARLEGANFRKAITPAPIVASGLPTTSRTGRTRCRSTGASTLKLGVDSANRRLIFYEVFLSRMPIEQNDHLTELIVEAVDADEMRPRHCLECGDTAPGNKLLLFFAERGRQSRQHVGGIYRGIPRHAHP